ncbi:hypothetical protein KSP40_PGU003064 [Platanthera guangdongensis]|uniref:Uncharacterized protein n=1 Tax=Platanthera guangdongensis TaxID=2320717 RepID=A0ABR2N329_9ASPA
MKHLWGKMGKIAREIQHVLMENSSKQYETNNSSRWRSDAEEMVACIRKHRRRGGAFVEEVGFAGGDLNHDMLGAALRSLGSPHALALHLFAGASSFRVYSKLSPALFPPADAAILVTVGDQMQESSGGVYRHVIGKPEYQFSEARREPISIAFLYSFPAVSRAAASFSGAAGIGRDEQNTISISQQLLIAVFLLFFYHIIAYVYI